MQVYADETRPFLQGARLTAWELVRDGIETTVITDNMAGALMRQGLIDMVVVGADRIAANGDTANKIGTYTVAVLAKEHGLPFYVAAPLSTIDLATPDGSHIPIEERNSKEVTHVGSTQMTPVGALHPQPRVRRDAAQVHLGHHHRTRRLHAAVHRHAADGVQGQGTGRRRSRVVRLAMSVSFDIASTCPSEGPRARARTDRADRPRPACRTPWSRRSTPRSPLTS